MHDAVLETDSVEFSAFVAINGGVAVDLFTTLDVFGVSESGDFSVLGLHFKELPLPSLTVVNALLPLVQICDLAPLVQAFHLQTLLFTVQKR